MASCSSSNPQSDDHYPAHTSLVEATSAWRPFEARLSGSTRWSECATSRSVFSAICNNFRPDNDALSRALDRLKANGAGHDDKDQSWSLATLDLISHAQDPDGIDRVITQLTELVATDSTNGDLRNDLAVAHLLRAETRKDPASLFESLNQIERAVEFNPLSAPIVFNHALIQQRLHLDNEAQLTWRRLRKLDQQPAWFAEIARHEQELKDRADRIVNAGPRNPESRAVELQRVLAVNLESGTTIDRQALRESVTKELLYGWVARLSAKNKPGADSIAAKVREIGTYLARVSGDSSVAHISTITSIPTSDMARALVAFDSGAEAFRVGSYAIAAAHLRSALPQLSRPAALALHDWAEIMIAFTEMYAKNNKASNTLFKSLERNAIARGDLALLARARWGMALSAARTGSTAAALDHYVFAGKIYQRLNERSNEGSMLGQGGDVLFLLGREDAAMRKKVSAMEALYERADPRAITGALVALGRELTEVGLEAAGVAFLREAVALAPSSSRVNDLPEALIKLSDAQVIAGRKPAAESAMVRADDALALVEDSTMHARLQMDLDQAQATLMSDSAPALALERLGMVEAYYRENKLVYDFASPLIKKARLNLRAGDTAAAMRDFNAAAKAIEAHTVPPSDVDGTRDRAAARRDVYQELAALALARFDTLAAFLATEQGRGNTLQRVPTQAPSVVTLSYSTTADETLLWIVEGSRARVVRIAVGQAQLNSMIAQFEAAVRRPSLAAQYDTLAKALHALLVAPAAVELTRATTIFVVPSGKLGRLSFAALRNAAGEPLIRNATLVYASRVSARVSQLPVTGRALVVRNPEFDSKIFSELDPLPAADHEATEIAGLLVNSRVLNSTEATKSSLLSTMPSASLIHFSGHARLVERSPGLSHLVLARAEGGVQTNSLSADEISALNLKALQLVVLSSCGTTQRRSRQDDSESGLASAFLAAGARGVISSPWTVGDAETAELMIALYTHLKSGKPAAEALRQAQLQMMSVPNASRGAWAAFKYETR